MFGNDREICTATYERERNRRSMTHVSRWNADPQSPCHERKRGECPATLVIHLSRSTLVAPTAGAHA